MSKIFRLHKGSSEGIIDWTSSNQHIGETFINTIEDPAGDNAKKQITSIPSPFARIDLVCTAFRYINSKKTLEGNTIYHRLVSEALDIAEIFFNAEALKDKIEIISWNAGILQNSGKDIIIDDNSDLGVLLKSSNKKLQLLGETLKMFLHQDRDAYNFDRLKSIYLLNYKKGPEQMNIIGGTSPATLFFSSANEDIRNYLDIQFGEHKVINSDYSPLYKRGEDFIKFIYALRLSTQNFSSLFKDFNKYLDLIFENPNFPNYIKDEIRDFNENTYKNTYTDIYLGNNEGFGVEILGNKLKGFRQKPPQSDFEIDKIKDATDLAPLILPNETFNEKLNYVNGKWKSEYRAPYFDIRALKIRSLPYQEHIIYPYLTVSDLLEPYIIRLPYPINKEKYFNGNFDETQYGYILPIKKELFKYFTHNDVIGRLPDGKNFFELVKLAADAVEAILRIPIKNGKYIKFSRLYTANQFKDHIQTPNEEENKGIIVEYQFGITVYPFLKTGQDDSADYRVVLIDTDILDLRAKSNQYSLSFYKENNPCDGIKIVSEKTRSNKNSGNPATSIYHIVDKEFDLIEVKPNSMSKGLIIPLFKSISVGSSKFSFAIDFGTTNTHIEYNIDGGNPMPFEITESDIQIGSLHANNSDTDILLKGGKVGIYALNIKELVPKEFLPEMIGRNFEHKFPVRTVISENKNLNISNPTYTLADFNVPFVYEKTDLPQNFKLTTNLKWANFRHTDDNKKRVEAFIEKLLILIRNKILLNGGDINETKIIWFYPSSMSEHRRNTLENAWNTFSKKYISNNITPFKLSESIAPYYYFSKKSGIIALDKPVACIDIGGGTTDIVIYKENVPVYLTSFKFAANSIFGDGYGHSMHKNGFIKKYYPFLKEKLKTDDDKLDTLYKAMEQIKENDSSLELITFFFSLESNKVIKKSNYNISFSELLKYDEDAKIIFVFFYAAIIYHLAKLMKSKKLSYPRFITFSGTGSKTINLADSNKNLKNLTEFTKIIFTDVYNEDTNTIELRQYDEPKEITCKGGLLCDNFADIDEVKTVLVGDTNQTLIPENKITYKEVNNEDLLLSVKTEVEYFIDKVFYWNEKYNYYNKFGAKPGSFDNLKITMKEDLKLYLKAGLEDKLKEVQENNNINIEETLFFYPLVGVLNKMAQNIFSPVEV